MLKGEIEPWLGMTTDVLPDDLVVEILSRLPLKSFCRFKCVCKYWLAFSSDPHYRQKLPRAPAGLLYQKHDTTIHLARLPSGDIDTTLSFVPCYEYPLELKECSNGLLLCYRGGHMRGKISDAIVCNPATEEWMALPDTQPAPSVTYDYLMLGFDPLWSQHFYVFNFEGSYFSPGNYKFEVKVFFSEDSTWSCSLWETDDACWHGSLFVNGVMYLEHDYVHELMALDAPDTCTQLLNERTIQLPGFPNGIESGFGCSDGRLCQSCGVLCYAQHELDGSMMRIWSLEGSDRWLVKHRLSVSNVLGRDMLLRTDNTGKWCFDYDILAFDLERELVILAVADRIDDDPPSVGPQKKNVLTFSTRTGKRSEFSSDCLGYYYVPYYGKFPASALRRDQDEC